MTITDIAEEAGVSTATVSRVLNNHSVRKESLIKVKSAIEKLDYRPNAYARGLMNKRSKAVGIMVTSMTNMFYMEITEVIERRIRNEGAMLFLGSTDGDFIQEKEYIDNLVSRQVDGIIVIDPSRENHENGFFKKISRKVPLILIHSYPDFLGYNAVCIDQYHGMEKVMNYLWDSGHRTIAFLRGAHGFSYQIKEKCWRDFLAVKGLTPREEHCIVISEGNTEDAIPLVLEKCNDLMSKDKSERPSAIFACNDLMASGLLFSAKSHGLKIPEDLTIFGHDNTSVSKHSFPPLSTVDLKLSSLGNAAVDLLLHAMNPEDPEPRRIFLEPELIVRGSS